MKICIKNCTLVSMDKDRDKIEYNMDILIEDNKIVKIGNNLKDSCDKIINADNKIVMPGLVNTHAHVPMSIFRETLDGYNLQDWLSLKIWPMEEKLTGDDVYYASCLSFIEMIKTGTTCINDLYFFTDDIIKAMNDTGVRLQTTRFLIKVIGNGEEHLNELENLINKYNGSNDRLTFNIGIHGLYTTDNDYVDKCLNLANKYNLPVHMHFCENSKEVSDIYNIYDKSPISVLKEKFSPYKTLLAHCVKLSESDIDEIKDMNISVSHCPVSNLKLGCGIAKVDYMLKKGINVSLGTDGQGSGCNLDLFETMKYTALLQKGAFEDPKLLPSYEVLKLATINGAKALGLDDKIGSIKEGKLADIIIIDINDTCVKPVNDLISELVYNVKGNNVVTTIIDGKIFMEDRILAFDNEELIYNKCDEIIKRISE